MKEFKTVIGGYTVELEVSDSESQGFVSDAKDEHHSSIEAMMATGHLTNSNDDEAPVPVKVQKEIMAWATAHGY